MYRWGSIDANLGLGKKLRSVAVHLLGRLHIYHLTEKPIVVFATRRGGSTLLMQMIASQPGVDFSGEPLNLWRFTPYFGQLPHPPRSQFIHLVGEDEQKVRSYFEDLLSGRIQVFNEWNPLSPLYSFRVHRLVVKLLGANTLIDWLAQHFDIEIVYLLRNPIPVALSCLGNKWGLDASAYLENEYFREELLGPERARFAEEILSEGTPLQKYVLEWCLENLIPSRRWPERQWLTLTYEETVMRPDRVTGLICDRLALPDAEAMRAVLATPSRTASTASQRQIKSTGPSALVTRWGEEVSAQDVDDVQRILDAFGITAYRASSPYPSSQLCHFKPLDSTG